MAVEGAGAVYQQTTRAERIPYVAEDALLALDAVSNVLHAPFLHGLLILAEHAFARAGHVGNNKVKAIGEGTKVGRVVIRHHTADGVVAPV